MFRVDTTRMDEDKTQLSLNALFEVRQWMVTTTLRSPRCTPHKARNLEEHLGVAFTYVISGGAYLKYLSERANRY